jgi:hypothetical protein
MKIEQLDDGRWSVDFDEYEVPYIADDTGPFYFAREVEANAFARVAGERIDEAMNSLAHLGALADDIDDYVGEEPIPGP